MKKTYESPKAILVAVDGVDVITASLPLFDDSNVLEDGWIPA